MPKFTIELPEGYSDLVPLLEKYAAEIRAAMPATAGGVAVDMAKCERAMAASAATLEQESIRRVLQCLDIDAPRVIILGRRHSKVGRYNAAYQTKAGPVTVMRSIYRDDGVRNGPTVDPVSLRAGVVGDGWLPDAAQAMAFVIQQQPSREAHEAMQRVGRLPYSRSSFERVGHEVGKLYETQHVEIEATLITQYEIPVAAASVSVGLDRVSVPMEEPRARPVGRPRKDAPENPIERKFRMAYVGTVTMHDKEGSAVHTVRYGRMPKGDAQGLCAGMANDVALMLKQRPDLKAPSAKMSETLKVGKSL